MHRHQDLGAIDGDQQFFRARLGHDLVLRPRKNGGSDNPLQQPSQQETGHELEVIEGSFALMLIEAAERTKKTD
jgi:hypothetical protein